METDQYGIAAIALQAAMLAHLKQSGLLDTDEIAVIFGMADRGVQNWVNVPSETKALATTALASLLRSFGLVPPSN